LRSSSEKLRINRDFRALLNPDPGPIATSHDDKLSERDPAILPQPVRAATEATAPHLGSLPLE
jgi:hypothetical protein